MKKKLKKRCKEATNFLYDEISLTLESTTEFNERNRPTGEEHRSTTKRAATRSKQLLIGIENIYVTTT